MERCAGERGKGFFWSVEESHIQSFEDQEAKNAQQQAAGGSQLNGGKAPVGKNKKGGAALHEPPLKRSVKLGNGPLPPPLTTTPLPMKSSYSSAPSTLTSPSPAPPFPNTQVHHLAQAEPSKNGANTTPILTTSTTTPNSTATPSSTTVPPPSSTEAATTAAAQSTSFISSLPPSVCIPIVIGQAPPSAIASASTSAPTSAHLPTPPIVLHDNTLILNPSVFSHLAPEQLKELEALGAQKALEILQSYIVRFLKERIRGEKGGDRGRGRQRGRSKRGGIGGSGRGGTPGGSGPFTNTPLPNPSQNGNTQATQVPQPPTSSAGVPGLEPKSTPDVVHTSVDLKLPVLVPAAPAPAILTAPPRSMSPIIVVDDDPDDVHDGPATKRRRLNGQGGVVAV